LDAVDRKIVSQLQVDGRTTLKELSRITGYTSMGVKRRIDNLIENNVITISALLNVEPLYLCGALLFLEIESAEAMDAIVERFRDCPRVVHLFTTLGGYNLIALVVAENQDTLESISIEKCSLRSNHGIRRSEFYPIGNIHYSPFLQIREHLTHKEKEVTPCNVDCRPCRRYQSQTCVGCPTTHYYHGPL
jgi:DNA-binding Lrp family transcriptional regulator